ncbi:hypothetical protein [Mycolicibacterium monacense]|nr:hypothetical protein [Mycolicibacterium monacense]
MIRLLTGRPTSAKPAYGRPVWEDLELIAVCYERCAGMSLWEDAAAKKAAERSQTSAEERADQRLAEQQRAQLKEFVEAMTRLGVAPTKQTFWSNVGIRDSGGTKKVRVPAMQGWTIKHDPGRYDMHPTHYFVATTGDVYSSTVPPHQKMFSKPPLPEPWALPIKWDHWGQLFESKTLGERLRDIIAEKMA